MGFYQCTFRARIYLRKARVLRMSAPFDVFAAFLLRLVFAIPAATLKRGKRVFMEPQPFAKLSFSRMWKFFDTLRQPRTNEKYAPVVLPPPIRSNVGTGLRRTPPHFPFPIMRGAVRKKASEAANREPSPSATRSSVDQNATADDFSVTRFSTSQRTV